MKSLIYSMIVLLLAVISTLITQIESSLVVDSSIGFCNCRVGDLIELERLHLDLRRLRIQNPNGIVKYSNNFLTYNSYVDCLALAVYESVNATRPKLCRRCLPGTNWSSLQLCKSLKCDLDSLTGEFTLQPIRSSRLLNDQNLFGANQAIAVYKLNTPPTSLNVCKVCQEESGEWSQRAEHSLCQQARSLGECTLSDLRRVEYQQFDYIRIRLESADGTYKLNQRDILMNGDKVPPGTVVLYQKYLSSLNITIRRRISKYNSNSAGSYYFNPFTKKFCRYCQDGVWSDIESCVSLHCDKESLTGQPDLVFIDKNAKAKMNGEYFLKLQNLFSPNSVLAVYSFGSEKFCRQCHENGEWSKYSLTELCKTNTTLSLQSSLHQDYQHSQNIYEGLYQKERKCNMSSLAEIEKTHIEKLDRLYLVSPDLRQKLLPDQEAKIPSRTLSIYQSQASRRRKCSICVDGIWSNISVDCTVNTDLYFCERENLDHNYTSIRLDAGASQELDDSSRYRMLFEPGKVIVEYKQSQTVKMCRVCESNGEWSPFSQPLYCSPVIGFFKMSNRTELDSSRDRFGTRGLGLVSVLRSSKSVKPCTVRDLESLELASSVLVGEYIRESIQTITADKYILSTEFIPDSSMAVYKTNQNQADLSRLHLKYCRKCSNGAWEATIRACPIEFGVKKCDPGKLRGVDYFVYSSDGSRVNELDKSLLVFPGKIVAVYQFGVQKYCKVCNDEGIWSSYPQFQLCSLVNWT